jgi:hypothetical protein
VHPGPIVPECQAALRIDDCGLQLLMARFNGLIGHADALAVQQTIEALLADR